MNIKAEHEQPKVIHMEPQWDKETVKFVDWKAATYKLILDTSEYRNLNTRIIVENKPEEKNGTPAK